MKNRILLSTLCMLIGLLSQAQNGSIVGRVVDANNLALPGASVYVKGSSKGTITDVNGNYQLLGILEGKYTVGVSYIGYKPVEQQVSVQAGQASKLTIELNSGIGLDEVVVTAAMQGQSRALNQQKSSANITNIIASDQIGKFPDSNIGDALKRIPGINVQYDQGEARFGNIRGTAPEYNSVTINGERIPSAEAENRSIQLDLIPSDMIQVVEVNKAITPDMDADAIGGSVNLVTISEPVKQRINISLGSGYNFLADKPMLTGSLIYGDRFAKGHVGMILSASYFSHQLGSDNVEAEWDGNEEEYSVNELQIRQYYLQRVRQSYSAAFDFKLSPNHTLYLKGIYNKREDWENRYRTVYKPDDAPVEGIAPGEAEKETKAGANNKNARLEDQRMMQFSLNGKHVLGSVKADWGLAYSKASEDRPQERYLEMVIEEQNVNFDLTDTEFPLTKLDPATDDLNNQWEFSKITEENQYTEDIDLTGKFNLEIPLLHGPFQSTLKLGAKYRAKEKMRENNFFEFAPVDEDNFMADAMANTNSLSKDDFMAGDKYNVGTFISKEFLGELNLENSAVFEKEADFSEHAGNFDAIETVTAGYFMLNQKLGSKLSAIVGLRVEHTASENQGYNWDDDEEELSRTAKVESNYTNVLPNIHLRYNFSPNNIVRVAYTNSIARPKYFDLVPFQQIEDGTDISIGNPNLKPTTSHNIDIMLERYFKSIGIISGGLFYKGINDFIVDERYVDYNHNGTLWENFTRPINGGNASLLGAEFAVQRRLDFLPGLLSGLGVYANYTFTHTKVSDFNVEGRENEELEMPGSPQHTLNASLSWEHKGFSSRISYNYASDFIEEVGETAFYDRYYDQVHYMDINLTYQFAKHYIVYADLNNILNQPLRYFQGKSNRTMQMEYYGMTCKAGLKINF